MSISLQYLKHCDDVVVIEEGRIAERGDHKELLTNDGPYAEMFRIFEETSLKPAKKTSMFKPFVF